MALSINLIFIENKMMSGNNKIEYKRNRRDKEMWIKKERETTKTSVTIWKLC